MLKKVAGGQDQMTLCVLCGEKNGWRVRSTMLLTAMLV